jgi:hypothetical protein
MTGTALHHAPAASRSAKTATSPTIDRMLPFVKSQSLAAKQKMLRR